MLLIAAPSGQFRPWTNHETGSWPNAVVIGDLNNDGRRDVAVLTRYYFDPPNDYTVHVFVQQPYGGLAPAVKYPISGPTEFFEGLDIGDVTGDGLPDVVVGTGFSVDVLQQNAQGTLDPPVKYPTPYSYQVRIGDFNSDGRNDVVAIDWGYHTWYVHVFLQSAAGTLGSPVTYAVPRGGRDEIEVGDVNGDGRDDIVIMSGQGQYANLGILLQTAAGGLGGPVFYDLGSDATTHGVAFADVTGDSRKDVVVSSGSGIYDSFVGVFAQNASGTLDPAVTVPSGPRPQPLEAADIDGDGRVDVAVVNGGYATMGIHLQDAAGDLGPVALSSVPYTSNYVPRGLALGDVNGDGRVDVAIADPAWGLVLLYNRMDHDLGLALDRSLGALPVGSPVTYTLSVTNQGLSPVSGVTITDTLPLGMSFVSSTPAGACSAAAGIVTCPLGTLPPGEAAVVTFAATALAPGHYLNQASVAGNEADQLPVDNAASTLTDFFVPCVEMVSDGSFEAGSPNPSWSESSENFGTPLCTVNLCGTGGGTAWPIDVWWAWFGRIGGVPEAASLSQAVTIPAGFANLRLRLWIGASSGNGLDYFRVLLDATEVFRVIEGDPAYLYSYNPVDIDVSAFGDGGIHTVTLDSMTMGTGVTSFSVDLVSLEWCPVQSLSIANAEPVAEGNIATPNTAFAVSLSQNPSRPVFVNYATGDPASGVAATPGSDYAAVSGTLSFLPGTVIQTVDVPVLDDALDEYDEAFALNLSAPTNASIAVGSALGTILDDDPLPTLSIADKIAVEGNGGTSNAMFELSVSPVSGRPVTASFSTADGTASAGADYVATSGTVTVPAGLATAAALAVPVMGDVLDEVDETFVVNLQGPMNAVLGDAQGQATIDDDDGPAVTIADVDVTEEDAGASNAVFSVDLSAPSPQTVSLGFQTSDGTAIAGSDYTSASGTLTYAPGVTARTLTVPILGDTLDEPNEIFHVNLSGAVDAGAVDGAAIGRVLDDDGGTIQLAGELVHGSIRWADLAAAPGPAADRDIYLLERSPHSSFEMVVDGTSGDVGSNGPLLQRLAPDLSTVVQDSTPIGAGSSRSLRMENGQAVPVTDYVQVRSAGCDVDCDAGDVYRISAWETTGTIARFNNSASQVSVLVIGNTTPGTVNGNLWFWDASGALLGSSAFSLADKAALVLNTASVPGVSGHGGTITVSHDGPYGALRGKAVSVEVGTGFTFDTPLAARPR